MSVSISKGAVTVYEIAADDAHGINKRKQGQGMWGDTRNRFVYFNHFAPEFAAMRNTGRNTFARSWITTRQPAACSPAGQVFHWFEPGTS